MFNKLYFVIGVIVVVAVVIAGFLYISHKVPLPVVCTMEAKLCPDGSYVSRTGPNCEFAQCPNITGTGIIKGKVSVGPICPTERVGVPCPVPPEAYTSREVMLYANDGVTIIKKMHFLADGTYSFSVPAGTYILDIPKQGIGGAQDLPKTLIVGNSQIVEYNFSIDTGIR